jgi:HTH-type transcriptional regulator/antitoxin HigA
MPTATYETLLTETRPEAIENESRYEAIGRRFGDLVGKGNRRTAAETKLMRLLAVLIEDYDRRHALPPDDSTPAERLQWLLQESGKTPSDLLPIFSQRSHITEALNGKRPISAAQARKLGALFHLKPGYFL